MKTQQETLNDCSGFEVPDGLVYMKTSDVIRAITAYHAQFTTTPSERENQLLKAFAKYVFMDEDADDHLFIEDFIQSDLFKSIPPAMPMPSREEAEKYANELADNSKHCKSHIEAVKIAMAMYDHLTERAKQ